MIPKIIHYCWFGDGAKSQLIIDCIRSWRKYCPDYEIVEWNESNFNFSGNEYSKSAYENKMWAFASDYARLKIIYENGGFYLDTDVELIKSLDSLREHNFYCGFEIRDAINTGLGFGATKNSVLVEKMLDEYDKVNFTKPDGSFTIYPTEFFSPKSYETGLIKTTSNTISIHHFNSSWENSASLEKKRRQHEICNLFGENIGGKIIFMLDLAAVVKKKGLFGTIKGVFRRLNMIAEK